MTRSDRSQAALRRGSQAPARGPAQVEAASSTTAFLASRQVQALRRTLRENHPTYLYHRVYEAFSNLLRSGSIYPGDPIPTQRELMDYLHLSRETLLTALRRLTDEGLIEMRDGRFTAAGHVHPHSGFDRPDSTQRRAA